MPLLNFLSMVRREKKRLLKKNGFFVDKKISDEDLDIMLVSNGFNIKHIETCSKNIYIKNTPKGDLKTIS